MVVLIVAIVMFSVVMKARYKARHPGHGLPDVRSAGETALLRDEVKQLKERLAVLERITVEKENSLAREIEDLRGR
jgi:hypothetical protein